MRSRTIGLVATLLSASALRMDAQDSLRIRAARHDTIVARAAVTAAFTVTSGHDDAVQVLPHIEMPADWTVIMGAAPITVGGRSSELLMVSIAVPARAAAGLYPIRVWITTTTDTRGAMDSVVVRVMQRHAVDVALLDKPGFVVSGKAYDASFLVRNRGNTPAQLHLRSGSSFGVASLSRDTMTLAADESRVIRPHVVTRAGLQSASDDVLEMIITSPDDTTSEYHASARVTVVPEPTRKIEEYQKVPANVRLRAASTTGVAPFEAYGHGALIDGGKTDIDFLFRGPSRRYSAFGERDEYRVQLTAPNWSARFGDNLFMLSQLTGGALPGFGAGVDGTAGRFSAGGYGQQFRRTAIKGSEAGAFVSARPLPDARIAVNVVDRKDGLLPGQIASGAASFTRSNYGGEVEVARSQEPGDTGATGMARTARFSGSFPFLSYDIGHLHADTGFAGAQHGSDHNYITASTSVLDPVSLGMNASRHKSDLSRATNVPYLEQLDLAVLTATFFDRYALELNNVNRNTTISSVAQDAQQTGARVHLEQNFASALVSLDGEGGRVKGLSKAVATYSAIALGLRYPFARGTAGVWADKYSGGALTKGANGTLSIGGDVSFRLNDLTQITANGFATKVDLPGARTHTQVDILATRALRNGNTISLRARVMSGGTASAADQSVAYLEYGMPLRLPVSRLRTPGRVYGKVVDAVTGRGVSNALVRLGPQVAITDKDGQVAFGGVPGGEHRLSMSQETSFADAVFVGDPTLYVDSTRSSPTTFQLAIARSARVDVSVRRFAATRTALGGAADSLADAGSLANATLILVGERDTLYRTSNEKGLASFTDVPPGQWQLAIRGDAPAFTRFEPDRLELTLAPGETKTAEFRLIPRKREVQLIGDGQELHPTTADPKTQPLSTTKTVKPNDQQRQNQE